MHCDLVLKAAALVAGNAAEEALALSLRRAFFCEARDISDMDVLLAVADAADVDADALRKVVRTGEATATRDSRNMLLSPVS